MPTVALVLTALWVLGSVSSLTMGGGLHVFLVVAVGMMLTRLIRGRTAAE
jgi:hypothetical protein